MNRPLLQLALDELSLENAYKVLDSGVDEVVDIIECGTLLLAAEGKKAIIKLRERYPDRKAWQEKGKRVQSVQRVCG